MVRPAAERGKLACPLFDLLFNRKKILLRVDDVRVFLYHCNVCKTILIFIVPKESKKKWSDSQAFCEGGGQFYFCIG
jgi:hypothetical protein